MCRPQQDTWAKLSHLKNDKSVFVHSPVYTHSVTHQFARKEVMKEEKAIRTQVHHAHLYIERVTLSHKLTPISPYPSCVMETGAVPRVENANLIHDDCTQQCVILYLHTVANFETHRTPCGQHVGRVCGCMQVLYLLLSHLMGERAGPICLLTRPSQKPANNQ